MDTPPDARELKDEAAQQAAKGNWKTALDLYLAIEQLEPQEGAWPRHAGEMCRRLNQTADAVADFARAVDVYAKTGFLPKAVAVCKVILEIDPRQTAVQAKLAALHASRSFTTGAAAAIAATEAKRPSQSVPSQRISSVVSLADLRLGALVHGADLSRHVPAVSAANVYEIPLGLEPDGSLDKAANIETTRAALGRTPLFSSLDEPRLLLLIERTRLRPLAKGEVLFQIGDPPDGLYVVAAGEVAVYSASEGQEIEVARLGEGSFFGETALLTHQPRTVTVRATADSELLLIDRDAVGALVADSPAVLLVLMRFMRDRLLTKIVETHRLFASLTSVDRMSLAGKFRFLEVEAGAVLMEQGKRAPGMFIILCGELEAHQDARTVQLGTGKTFGEASLLGHRPAASTIRALKKSFLLMLPLVAFQEVTATHPHILDLIPSVADDW